MRWIVLPPFQTFLLDFFLWLIIPFIVSYFVSRMSTKRFNFRSPLYRFYSWEKSGIIYEDWFKIKVWKSWVPDAAGWFPEGFPKARLKKRDLGYLNLFFFETCRGEFAHWITLSLAPLFFLWNKPWVGFLMMGVGLAINLPCILIQRYNRIRLYPILEEKSSRKEKILL